MFSISVVLLSTFLFVIGHPNVKDSELFIKHYERVYNYDCRLPHPRVFRIHELIPEKEQITVYNDFLPRQTILHRCDKDSGCCKDLNHVCSPKVIEDVDLVFYENNSGKRSNKYIHVMAQNHTLCTCKSIVVSIK